MSGNRRLDFLYAVQNTELLLVPERHLETFGNTLVHYHHVSESMDSVGQVRIRRGQMKINRPQIVTPDGYRQLLLEGFGEEAAKYAQWLQDHDVGLRVLRYGYALSRQSFSEEFVTDSLDAVAERVRDDAKASSDPFAAVVKGVDDPWDVCLVRLFAAIVEGSFRDNVREMAERRLFETEDGVPVPVREEIERAFRAAASDSSYIRPLGALLRRHNLFERYEDRFFSLVRSSGKQP